MCSITGDEGGSWGLLLSTPAAPRALDNIVTDPMYIIHILHAISLAPFMPSPAIGAKSVGDFRRIYISKLESERNPKIPKLSRSIRQNYSEKYHILAHKFCGTFHPPLLSGPRLSLMEVFPQYNLDIFEK